MRQKRVVLITGVAGGIGSATATVFSEAGWYVVGVDRNEMDVTFDGRFIQADISNPAEIDGLIASISEKEGRLDALVNNAAMQIAKPFVETTLDEWDGIMNVNLRSVFWLSRQAYPLVKQTEGAIINVSSVHAIATSRNIAAYAATKGAMLAMTRAMALEFGEDQVRVNAILPGAVDTSMLHDGLNRGHVEGDDLQALIRGLGKKHVMGRVGRPDEIGKSILFLADNSLSSFMTGQAMVVDGGATARLSTE